jgi:F-box and WD-40 domain protein 1/11
LCFGFRLHPRLHIRVLATTTPRPARTPFSSAQFLSSDYPATRNNSPPLPVSSHQLPPPTKMLQRKSNLSHRPKTSSAVDDGLGPQRFDTSMKRRASQLFHPHVHDVRDTGPPALKSVQEGTKVLRCSPHNVGECLEGAVAGMKQFCRRYSTSSKRPSNLDLGPMKMRKSSHESNSTDVILPEQSQPQSQTQTKSSMMRRFSSIRHRRPATSGPSGNTARFNTVPPQIPANCASPLSTPADSYRGSAARAAAAAQNERLSLTKQAKREAEMTARFLSDGANSVCPDIVTKDSESGIGMTYSSPVEGTNNVLEKKLGMLYGHLIDPTHF